MHSVGNRAVRFVELLRFDSLLSFIVGYAAEGAIDLNLLLQAHPELRNQILPDGSIRSSLYSSFPLIQFRNYLQVLLFCLTVLQNDKSISRSQRDS